MNGTATNGARHPYAHIPEAVQIKAALDTNAKTESMLRDELEKTLAEKNVLARRLSALDPENDGREVDPKRDPLADLRAAGALVGYEELVAATATPPVPIWYSGVERDSHIEATGPSGQGKTTFVMLFAIARANPTGKPVTLLGREVTPGEDGTFVVIIEEENGKYSLRRKAELSCELLGLPVAETLARVIFVVRRRVTAGDATWRLVEDLGRQKRVSAVVVDSRARVLRKGESNKEEDQAEIANQVHGMVEACVAPTLVISHTRKGERGSAPSEIEDISGSSQRGAGADVVLMVTARKNDRGAVETSTVKFTKLRDALEDHPNPITYKIARDVEGRWALVETEAPIQDDRPLTDRIREILAANPEGLTKYRMREMLGTSGATLEKALSVLFSERALSKQQRVIGGKPRDVFSLREGGSDATD